MKNWITDMKDEILVRYWRFRNIKGKMKIILAFILQTILAILILALNYKPLFKDKSIIEILLIILAASMAGFVFSFVPIMIIFILLYKQLEGKFDEISISRAILIVSLIGIWYLMFVPAVILKNL